VVQGWSKGGWFRVAPFFGGRGCILGGLGSHAAQGGMEPLPDAETHGGLVLGCVGVCEWPVGLLVSVGLCGSLWGSSCLSVGV